MNKQGYNSSGSLFVDIIETVEDFKSRVIGAIKTIYRFVLRRYPEQCPNCKTPLEFDIGDKPNWNNPGTPAVYFCPRCGWEE